MLLWVEFVEDVYTRPVVMIQVPPLPVQGLASPRCLSFVLIEQPVVPQQQLSFDGLLKPGDEAGGHVWNTKLSTRRVVAKAGFGRDGGARGLGGAAGLPSTSPTRARSRNNQKSWRIGHTPPVEERA